MPVCLAFLEFLGTTEMLVIAVVALIIFGPRKLPEIGRTVGKSLAEFKRASEDFKRTWEREVEFERIESEPRAADAVVGARAGVAPVEQASADAAGEARGGGDAGGSVGQWAEGEEVSEERTIARTPAASEPPSGAAGEDPSQATPPEPARKHEWL